jgi:DNA-directed RNA polymerase specialized sigma24 family protein
VLPRIPAVQFDALAQHAFYGTRTRTAVRLVLVNGKSQTEVASLIGMSIYSVHRATKRFLAKLALDT